jgi:lysophospholipase L1-like esterase
MGRLRFGYLPGRKRLFLLPDSWALTTMKTTSFAPRNVVAVFLPLVLIGGPAAAETPDHAAVKPVPRSDNPLWLERHEGFLARAGKGGVDVLFLGDAITQGWEGAGKEAWQKHFEPLRSANFGIGGDRTQNLLWRVGDGKELQGLRPKVVVLLIGTNNLSSDSAEEIADGITAVVREVKKQLPQTRVLLLGVLPRGARADDKFRDKIKEVNRRAAKLDADQQLRYLDAGARLLDKDGTLPSDVMKPDAVHLTAKGYQVLAEAVAPALGEMLKK